MTARRRTSVRGALRDAWRRLRGGELRPERAAGSVGVGLFVGFLPTYGIQTFFCLLFTVPLRLDFPLAWVATNIANPITALFIIALDIEVGGFLLRGTWANLSTDDIDIKHLGAFLVDGMVGGVAIGAAVGVVGGFLTLYLMRRAARLRERRVRAANALTR